MELTSYLLPWDSKTSCNVFLTRSYFSILTVSSGRVRVILFSRTGHAIHRSPYTQDCFVITAWFSNFSWTWHSNQLEKGESSFSSCSSNCRSLREPRTYINSSKKKKKLKRRQGTSNSTYFTSIVPLQADLFAGALLQSFSNLCNLFSCAHPSLPPRRAG